MCVFVCLFVCLSRAAISALNCRRPLVCCVYLQDGRHGRRTNKSGLPSPIWTLSYLPTPSQLISHSHQNTHRQGDPDPSLRVGSIISGTTVRRVMWKASLVSLRGGRGPCRRSDVIRRAPNHDNNRKHVGKRDQIVLSCRSAPIFSLLCRAQASVGARTAASCARDYQEKRVSISVKKVNWVQ